MCHVRTQADQRILRQLHLLAEGDVLDCKVGNLFTVFSAVSFQIAILSAVSYFNFQFAFSSRNSTTSAATRFSISGVISLPPDQP